jgi:hypothetical protein
MSTQAGIALERIEEGASFYCTRFKSRSLCSIFLASLPTEHKLSGHDPTKVGDLIRIQAGLGPSPRRLKLLAISYPITTSQEQRDVFQKAQESSHDHCTTFLDCCTFSSNKSEDVVRALFIDLTPGQVAAMSVEGTIEYRRWKSMDGGEKKVVLGDVERLSTLDIVDKLITPIIPELSALYCVGILRPEGAFPQLDITSLELRLGNIPVKWITLADLSYASAAMLWRQSMRPFPKQPDRNINSQDPLCLQLVDGSLVDLISSGIVSYPGKRESPYFVTTSKADQVTATLRFFRGPFPCGKVTIDGLSPGPKGAACIKFVVGFDHQIFKTVVNVQVMGFNVERRIELKELSYDLKQKLPHEPDKFVQPEFGIDGIIGAVPE